MSQEMLTISLFVISSTTFIRILSLITECSNLDSNLRNSQNFGIFKNNIHKFIRPKPNSFLTAEILRGLD